MRVPQPTNIIDLLGSVCPGFYWEGVPYKISSLCSQACFNDYWEKGWSAGYEARPNCSEHDDEPFKTIYGFAYSKAPRKTVSFRAIAVKAMKESLPECLSQIAGEKGRCRQQQPQT